jgi:hypothetical protein
MELPRGAIEDCRRGEEPSAVFLGDRDRGGGSSVRLLRRIWCEVVRSGMLLSCTSIDSDAVIVSLRFGGDFSGDEKMPEIGSRPCSSYTPRSASVMPVFLRPSATGALSICLFSPPSLHANVVELVLAIFALSLGRHREGNQQWIWRRAQLWS